MASNDHFSRKCAHPWLEQKSHGVVARIDGDGQVDKKHSEDYPAIDKYVFFVQN